MAKELSMNGRKKILTVQKEFTEKFNYLTLVFLDSENKPLDGSLSIAEVRTRKGSDLSIVASLKVNTLEQRLMSEYGLKVEVAYSREGKFIHTQGTTDHTLNELNEWCGANGCDRIEIERATQNDDNQNELAAALTKAYPRAVVKKINEDNFLDIHIPDIHPKRGTHLYLNTAGRGIKVGFYVRDEEFVHAALAKSIWVEQYSQGVRLAGNPSFADVESAVKAALDFLKEISGIKTTSAGEVESGPDGAEHQSIVNPVRQGESAANQSPLESGEHSSRKREAADPEFAESAASEKTEPDISHPVTATSKSSLHEGTEVQAMRIPDHDVKSTGPNHQSAAESSYPESKEESRNQEYKEPVHIPEEQPTQPQHELPDTGLNRDAALSTSGETDNQQELPQPTDRIPEKQEARPTPADGDAAEDSGDLQDEHEKSDSKPTPPLRETKSAEPKKDHGAERKSPQNTVEYPSSFYCENAWDRNSLQLTIKPFPDVFRNNGESQTLFRKFSPAEIEKIDRKIRETQSYILLPFVKEILGRKVDLSALKSPFWFVPFVAYGNQTGSFLYFNQDGLWNNGSTPSQLTNVAHVDAWDKVSVERGYNGLFDDNKDDDRLSALRIGWVNPRTGNSGALNLVEMHGEQYGSSLRIVQSIWEAAWKDVVDRSRHSPQFLLGPPPNVESFNSWDELLKWAGSR